MLCIGSFMSRRSRNWSACVKCTDAHGVDIKMNIQLKFDCKITLTICFSCSSKILENEQLYIILTLSHYSEIDSETPNRAHTFHNTSRSTTPEEMPSEY